MQERGLLSELGGVVNELENGLGADQLEQKLDSVLGETLLKVESVLPMSLAEKLVGLMKEGLPPSIVQAVGQSLALLENGVAIQTVDAYLKSVTGGLLSSLDETLGLNNIENIIHP